MKPIKKYIVIPSLVLSVALPHLALATENKDEPIETQTQTIDPDLLKEITGDLIEFDPDSCTRQLVEINAQEQMDIMDELKKAQQDGQQVAIDKLKALAAGDNGEFKDHPLLEVLNKYAAILTDKEREALLEKEALLARGLDPKVLGKMKEIRKQMKGKVSAYKAIELKISDSKEKLENGGSQVGQALVTVGDKVTNYLAKNVNEGSKTKLAAFGIGGTLLLINFPIIATMAAGTVVGGYALGKVSSLGGNKILENGRGQVLSLSQKLSTLIQSEKGIIEALNGEYDTAMGEFAALAQYVVDSIPTRLRAIKAAKIELQFIKSQIDVFSAQIKQLEESGQKQKAQQLEIQLQMLNTQFANVQSLIAKDIAILQNVHTTANENTTLLVISEFNKRFYTELIRDLGTLAAMENAKYTLIEGNRGTQELVDDIASSLTNMMVVNNKGTGEVLGSQAINKITLSKLAHAAYSSVETVIKAIESKRGEDSKAYIEFLQENPEVAESVKRLKSNMNDTVEELEQIQTIVPLTLDQDDIQKAIEQAKNQDEEEQG